MTCDTPHLFQCPTCHDAVSWRAQERAAEEEEERQRQRRLVVERFSFQIATKGDERECPPVSTAP